MEFLLVAARIGLANMQLENGMMGYDKKVRIIDLPA